ncbi:MAG: YidC/Oxa1 family membrane protein insertase [Clostridiales bacterium]|nr:YidC/Oxa1 family membrane protein insertase [Clostridiales bacterium]
MFEYLITRPLGWIIEQIYSLVANYGLAIIIFTIIVKLILLPLNIKSQKAMRKQQKIQPIMQELQKKYANDQEKLQRETMKLYKENNISMTGGCLPMLIQMPILVGLYQVIQKPLSYLMGVDWMEQAVIDKVYMLRDAMAASIGNLANQTEAQLAQTSQIQLSRWAQTINGPRDPWTINFNFLGLDLANTPSAALGYIMQGDFSNIAVIALLLIPVLAILAQVFTMKLTQAQTGQNNNDSENQAAQMSKTMNLMMPVMTGVFTFTLPSGIGIYWIISSLMQAVQQLALNKYFDLKGDDFEIKAPAERKKLHGKKSKKR